MISDYTVIVEYAKPRAAGPHGRRFQVYVEAKDRSWSDTGTIVLTWQTGSYIVASLYVEDCMSREFFDSLYQRFSVKYFPAIIREIEFEANNLRES